MYYLCYLFITNLKFIIRIEIVQLSTFLGYRRFHCCPAFFSWQYPLICSSITFILTKPDINLLLSVNTEKLSNVWFNIQFYYSWKKSFSNPSSWNLMLKLAKSNILFNWNFKSQDSNKRLMLTNYFFYFSSRFLF